MLAKCNGRTEEETKNSTRMGSYRRFRKGFAKGETYLSSSSGGEEVFSGRKGKASGESRQGQTHA